MATIEERRMTNARDYDPVADGFHVDDPVRLKKLIKLGLMITDRVEQKLARKLTEHDPEIWALDCILEKTEEVDFLLSFKKIRVPYTVPEIAKRNNMTVEDTQKMVDHLAWVGALELVWRNEETGKLEPGAEKKWQVPIFVPGMAEFVMMNPTLTAKYPKLATFFNLMTQMPLEKVTPFVPEGGAGIGMHVIPVERAIPATNESMSVEHISHWLDKYDVYSVGLCTCRKQQTMRGEGSGEIEGDFCIGVGDMADYCVQSGKGRYITREEVLEVLERAEKRGFVHQTTNIDGENKIVAICNCAPGVCNALRTSQLYNTPNMSASAYRAKVETEKCVACGKCVEVCPVGAAKLGQKLCLKDGSVVKYPKTELPNAVNWGPDKWNPNYRNDAKINCYETGTSPCKTACPAHLAVQGYIRMAAEGRYLDALKLIKQDNPFPAVCGAICNRRCEDRCTRGTIDRPVAIDEIKKFIAAQELKEENRYVPECFKDDGGEWEDLPIAVIGAGPAGLSAAYYLREHGYPVTVFEKEEKPGGMLRYGVPNFRLEKDVIDAEIDVIRAMGAEIKCGVEVGKDVTIEDLRKQGYKAFYLAIGMQGGRYTGVPGEDADGVLTGVDFLRKVNSAEGYPLHGKTIVVGGGNVAIDVARSALRAGSSEVTMLCLEGVNEMPAAKDEVAEAKEEGIIIKNGWGPKEILTENGKVTGIVFKQCTDVFDKDHRFNPVYDESVTISFDCDNVLLSIGQAAVWGDLLKDTKVELRRNGTVIADPITLQTAEPDIFVGGDIFHGAKFAIDAIAEGKTAFVSINRYVHPGNDMMIARDLREFIELDRDDILVESYDNAQRQVPGMKPGDATKTFEDLRLTLTEEQVKAEANRCLKCGATTVDENRCIGCGLCTTKCEFDAIHLERTHPNATRMYKAEQKIAVIAPYALKRVAKIVTKRK